MKIAIVGANSYIARNIIFQFKKKDNIDLFLYDINDKHIDDELNYRQINILDKNQLKNIDFNCDIMYVFSGKTGTIQGYSEYETFIKINEIGLLNILDEHKNRNSKAKIIFPSTRLIYKGKPELLAENSEKEFKTIYAINKFACEQYLKLYNKMFDMPYAIFRICVPYGTLIKNASSYGTAEFMLEKARNKQNITLYGKGEIRRTLIHISDLCNALIAGGMSDKCINDVYNIGGENYSLDEMAQKIAKKYAVKVEYTKWPEDSLKIESGDTIFCSDKFDKLLNFSYKTKFDNWIKS